MIDMDVVHFVFQFPVVIVEATVAVLMLMRWRWAEERRIVDIDPVVTLLLALFVAAIALKQGFWMLQGAIQAADLEEMAHHFGRGHWLPVVGNFLILVTGMALVSRVGSAFIGRLSYAIGGSAFLILIGVGAAVTRWG